MISIYNITSFRSKGVFLLKPVDRIIQHITKIVEF